jgi:hypothetical protein
MSLWDVMEESFFFEDLIYYFQMIGKTTLNLISNPATTTIWEKGWWNANDLNMIGDWAIEWTNFTKLIQRVHVRLSDSIVQVHAIV